LVVLKQKAADTSEQPVSTTFLFLNEIYLMLCNSNVVAASQVLVLVEFS
jgi:hypothetical protein